MCNDEEKMTDIKVSDNNVMPNKASMRIARCGVLIAVAIVFSYLEVLVPFNFGIPGIKLGLANAVTLLGLYLISPTDTCVISMLRIFIIGVMFGNGMSIIYSLSGGILSFIVMFLIKKIKGFSVMGVSIAGGVAHNVGQIAAASVMLSSASIFSYLPVLLVAGIITGMLIGILTSRIIPVVKLKIEI